MKRDDYVKLCFVSLKRVGAQQMLSLKTLFLTSNVKEVITSTTTTIKRKGYEVIQQRDIT